MKEKTLILLLLITGCTQTITLIQQPTQISDVIPVIKNETIDLRFNLFKNETQLTNGEGTLTINILTTNNEIIHTLNMSLTNNNHDTNEIPGVYEITINPSTNLNNAYYTEIIINLTNNSTLQTKEVLKKQISENNYQNIKPPAQPPATIQELIDIIIEGEEYLIICLADNQNQPTSGEGNGTLTINEWKKELYKDTFTFTNEEFNLMSNGKNEMNCYKLKINTEEIKKSYDNTATLEVNLTTNNKTLTKSINYWVENYSNEELMNLYEEEYNDNKITENHAKNLGGLEITLVSHGEFKEYDSTEGIEVTSYRVDLKIKNLGSSKKQYYNYDALLIINSTQYQKSRTSNLNSQYIYPGVTLNGYLIFNNVNLINETNAIIYAGDYYDSNKYKNYEFEYNISI